MEATQCELAQVHGPRMTGTSLASASSAGKLAVGNQLQSQPASMRSPQPRTLRVQEERTREPPPRIVCGGTWGSSREWVSRLSYT